MLTLAEIALQAHAIACLKGWHDRPMREYRVDVDSRQFYAINHDAVLRSHALIHSEISEALVELDATRFGVRVDDGKPEGFVVELADIVIRVCDTVQALGLSFASDWFDTQREAMKAQELREHLTSRYFDQMRSNIDAATECVRGDAWLNYTHALRSVVQCALEVATLHGLDLPAAIEAKMAYNATRPIRHGGKQA